MTVTEAPPPFYADDAVTIWNADALALPIPDESVDLVATSPPYFGLRSYTDGGEHYDGQIGSEATPREFVDALIAATAEMVRVLKPSGSIWVNLGDKYASYEANRGTGGASLQGSTDRGRPAVAARSGLAGGGLVRNKSLMGLPWRYALRCIDELGLILRAEVIWSKPNGLPESVTDRVRRSHEQWFHFTREPRYFSAVDEIREDYSPSSESRFRYGFNTAMKGRMLGSPDETREQANQPTGPSPLGKLPGSVWDVPTQPLKVPAHLTQHFAAFPLEWPRRIIRGWSPSGYCMACNEPRKPVVASVGLDMNRPQSRRAHEIAERAGLTEEHFAALLSVGVSDTGRGAATQSGTGKNTPEVYRMAGEARAALGGYSREYLLRRPTGFRDACACEMPTAPTRPAVVLDPFGGTGTVALMARVLGRQAHHVDLSGDYCELAKWRVTDPGELARAMQVEKPPAVPEDMDSLLDLIEDGAA